MASLEKLYAPKCYYWQFWTSTFEILVKTVRKREDALIALLFFSATKTAVQMFNHDKLATQREKDLFRSVKVSPLFTLSDYSNFRKCIMNKYI